MKVSLGADHAGYKYKELTKSHLEKRGHEVIDCGTDSDERCNYPDFVRPAAQKVANGESDRCVVFGGSGNGEAIVANKVKGVRCALAWSEDTATWGRSHNDANGLAIGERTINEEELIKILDLFLETDFEGGRHIERVNGIE